MKNIQTLHCHTTTSDGEMGYYQVLKVCKKYGIATVAFTDHDSLPSRKDLDILFKNKKHPTKWIIGLEINSGWPKEIGSGPGSAFDIVGLFVNPLDQKLVEYCKKTQAARVSRMEKIVRNLKSLGFKITAKDCLKASNGEAVGRPHIVEALKFNENNLNILKKIKNKMEQESRSSPELKNKYETMLKQEEGQYWYTLLLGNESFIPGIVADYEYWVNMDQAVSLIRKAGGLAFLAHYFTIRKVIAPEIIEKFISQKRLNGLETVFCIYSKERGIVFEKYVEECRNICKSIVEKFNCLQSGGNDAHTEQSLIDFAANESLSKSTIGMGERIIEKSKVNLEWSSFS